VQRQLDIGGESTMLHLSRPATGTGAPIVLLHPWWGLNEDVRGLADRLAGSGFVVAAPDLYRGKIATTIDEAERLSSEMDETFGDATTLAAVDAVLAEAGSQGPACAIGLSFGAAWALWLPAQRPEVVATVIYYGTMQGPSLSRSRAPVLGHFAESDPYEDDESIAAFEHACRDASREVEIHRYPGTGHWFAEPSRDAYVPAAAELAFERTADFLRRHLLEG
jgi:carboxymethylenebutenolidase